MKVGGLEMQGLDTWTLAIMPEFMALRSPLMAVVLQKAIEFASLF